MTLPKPKYGQACNGCGLCCQLELCPIGAALFNRWEGPCPALQEVDKGYGCGLIIDPAKYAPVPAMVHGKQKLSQAATWLNAAGVGCDMPDIDMNLDEHQKSFARMLKGLRDDRKMVKAVELWGLTFTRLRKMLAQKGRL